MTSEKNLGTKVDVKVGAIKEVNVAVGVLKQGDHVLLAKRADNTHQGGKWEFPGGKIESGESALEALIRELHEELNIKILASKHLMDIEHTYPDLKVFLHIYLVERFVGHLKGNEGQEVQWIFVKDLSNWPLPDANLPIIEKIKQL